MDRQVAPYFGSSLEAPVKDKLSYEPEHHDLLTFLAASQRFRLDFLPITWQPKLTVLGYGGTARVSQSAVDVQTSFAYKRMYTEEESSNNFMRLTAEVAAFRSKSVVGHPNIVQLEGICWEVESKTDRVLPVLVFEKAEFGDMRRFMATEDGRNVDMDTRIKWCLELAGALHSLHSGGKFIRGF
jgi:serine/threonine protein kinase